MNAPTSPRWTDRTVLVTGSTGIVGSRLVERLVERGLTYPCYCTRREILAEVEAAVSAPHGPLPAGAYPGTCAALGPAERAEREAEGRRPSCSYLRCPFSMSTRSSPRTAV